MMIGLLTQGCSTSEQKDAQTTEEISSSKQEELANAPDEMLSSFSVSGYGQDGKKQWDLEGKSADIMDEKINMTDVTAKIYGKDAHMNVVADQGSLNRLDNSVHLEKNVFVTSDDGATMTTDYLNWDAQNEKLFSDAPVWLKRGMMEASGKGIIAQPALNFVELKQDVTVEVTPESRDTAAENKVSEISSTVITCDGPLEVDYQNNVAFFHDNVKVKDSRGEIFSDTMDVYFATETDKGKQLEGMEGMGIEKVIAQGAVEIHHGQNISYSKKAVYDTNTGRLTLTGQPKLVIYSTDDFALLK